MKTEMLMPQMGESIAEATIIRWHKAVGDTVKQDEMILEISTDKVDSEIPSPASGTLVEILAEEGATVSVKSLIAVIDSEGGAAAPSSQSSASKPEPAPAPEKEEPVQKTEDPNTFETKPLASSTQAPSYQSTKVLSPLVKNIASQNNISLEELESIQGSGTHGRITKEDILYYIESKKGGTAPSTPSATSAAPPARREPAQVSVHPVGTGGETVVPFDNMRKAIAEHMVRSKQTSPHVYSVAEVDMTAVGKWRKANKSLFKEREGFNLSYMPCFIEAIVKGLSEYPQINASVRDNSYVYKKDINVGCAVALGDDGLGGLIVPSIKNAGSLNFNGIARSLNDLIIRARSKKLLPDDVQGGTFTVTNIGSFGNIIGFPIISQPQLAILALGAIKKRPVVVDDAIAIRDICYLTLSYDHRAIDGALAGSFLRYVTQYLEGWDIDRTL